MLSDKKSVYFAGYSSEDEERVAAICKYLSDSDISIRRDKETENDDEWADNIKNEIRHSSYFLLFVTDKMFGAKDFSMINQEYRAAKECGCDVLVIALDPLKAIQSGIAEGSFLQKNAYKKISGEQTIIDSGKSFKDISEKIITELSQNQVTASSEEPASDSVSEQTSQDEKTADGNTVRTVPAVSAVNSDEIEKGEKCLKSGDFDGAASHFNRQIDIDSTDWRPFWGLFKCSVKAKNDDEIYFPGFLEMLSHSEYSNDESVLYYKTAKDKALAAGEKSISFDRIEIEYARADRLQEEFNAKALDIINSYKESNPDSMASDESRKILKKKNSILKKGKKASEKETPTFGLDKVLVIVFFILSVLSCYLYSIAGKEMTAIDIDAFAIPLVIGALAYYFSFSWILTIISAVITFAINMTVNDLFRGVWDVFGSAFQDNWTRLFGDKWEIWPAFKAIVSLAILFLCVLSVVRKKKDIRTCEKESVKLEKELKESIAYDLENLMVSKEEYARYHISFSSYSDDSDSSSMASILDSIR